MNPDTPYAEIADNATSTIREAISDAYNRGWFHGYTSGHKQGLHDGLDEALAQTETNTGGDTDLMTHDAICANTHDGPATDENLLINKLTDYHYKKGWVEGIASLNDNTDAAYRRGLKAGRQDGIAIASNAINHARTELEADYYTTAYRAGHEDALEAVEDYLRQHNTRKD